MSDDKGLPWRLSNKKLGDMTRGEFELTLDTLSSPIDEQMLNDARKGRDQDLTVVVALLHSKEKTPRLVHANLDYGDGEGLAGVTDVVDGMKRWNRLQSGEHLEVREIPMSLETLLGLSPKAG